MNTQKETRNDVILQVRGLKTQFKTDDGLIKAVDGVDFDLHCGETLGIVGESGSGKSVTSLSIMKLIPSPPGRIVDGSIMFNGVDILKLNEKSLRSIRGADIAMIFQDPMTSLNPFLKISTQLIETLVLHRSISKRQAKEQAVELLEMVGIPDSRGRIDNYPHQFSGGMRQRVMIAMALSCNPKILIADEPTTALDVTIQAQIMELIKDLSARLNTAVIIITHDLGVVASMCDTICVMYAGRIVEQSTAMRIFHHPRHPYTRGLIRSAPRLDQEYEQDLFSIPGQPPLLYDLPECCPFHPRCDHAMDICRAHYPSEKRFESIERVNCWLYSDKKE